VGLGLVLGACSGAPRAQGPPPERLDRTGPAPDPEAPRRTVVLVSVDGLAPWVLEATPTPHLDALARTGASARRAETVVPSLTLPSHTSMLSGVRPDRHGVASNDWRPGRRIEVPTVFTFCARGGLRCGLFAGKPKLVHFALEEPGVERYVFGDRAEAVFDAALDYLDEREPHFVMVHLAEVDLVGHATGWGGRSQREIIVELDALLGDFLDEARDELEGRLTVVVTADHGGEGRRHGRADERHVRIPWIAWGDGVPEGAEIARVHTVDTAPTVLGLLGLPAPPTWEGRSWFPFDAGVAAREPPEAGAAQGDHR